MTKSLEIVGISDTDRNDCLSVVVPSVTAGMSDSDSWNITAMTESSDIVGASVNDINFFIMALSVTAGVSDSDSWNIIAVTKSSDIVGASDNDRTECLGVVVPSVTAGVSDSLSTVSRETESVTVGESVNDISFFIIALSGTAVS